MMCKVNTLRRRLRFLTEFLDNPDKERTVYYSQESLNECATELAELEKNLPIAEQVKEKYGGLRFYFRGGTEKERAIVSFAERMSLRICEVCGTTKNTRLHTFGWYKTLCPEHAMEHYSMSQEEYDEYEKELQEHEKN